MAEILHHLGCKNPTNNGRSYLSTGAGFQPSTVWLQTQTTCNKKSWRWTWIDDPHDSSPVWRIPFHHSTKALNGSQKRGSLEGQVMLRWHRKSVRNQNIHSEVGPFTVLGNPQIQVHGSHYVIHLSVSKMWHVFLSVTSNHWHQGNSLAY